ncbi:magnesium transporter [Nocardioides sp. AE5]|uniref:magnesium transporter n=1 Tax=Nocardioides sp. AE5 TaxID=2962573 RepID=UPI002881E262|nr:magnesium transporter [Nocardioides sp. AE5]MDT0202850.1 magnesium transporter [Nocardioides sp. AE5]
MVEALTTEEALARALADRDLLAVSRVLEHLGDRELVDLIERSSQRRSAVLFRLLAKDVALRVFERLDPSVQGELFLGLADREVTDLFTDLDPDDRVLLMDELPAAVARRLIQQLTPHERDLTWVILGHRAGSVGRRMSPEYVSAHPHLTVAEALDVVRRRVAQAETIYTLPVTDPDKKLVGVLSLRDLFEAGPEDMVGDIMGTVHFAHANDDAEEVARLCVDLGVLAMPIVDSETRLLGILTVDDAQRILEQAEEEDAARAGATEPLRRPYLSTSIAKVARARVVWLLVLAMSAILTVQVLEIFEATLEQKVVLALFIPLLTGTGGNTGSQAATTITRALAMGDVRTSDVWAVMLREVRVGAMLGLLLGSLGFALAALAYDTDTGLVIGLTLFCVCSMAATVGGVMPMIAKKLRVDPAVFSTPFITTFCDATGLLIYFMIAKAVLGI